jgi:hypothetical protein
MGVLPWLAQNWFALLQTASIAVGLFTTAYTIRVDTKERKIQNLLALTSAHREIWSQLYLMPELARVWHEDVNVGAEPVTLQERLFVRSLILHLNVSFKARKGGMDFDDEALSSDIRQFFSKPVPRAVWERSKVYLSPDFVQFVESNFSAKI